METEEEKVEKLKQFLASQDHVELQKEINQSWVTKPQQQFNNKKEEKNDTSKDKT